MSWLNRGLSANQVARLAGCSYRQIDHWCRRGYITPANQVTGSGSYRVFDDEAVAQASVIAMISDALGKRRGDGYQVGVSDEVLALVAANWSAGSVECRNGVTVSWPVPAVVAS